MKNVTLKFGGFYNSLHASLIDSMLDNYFMDEDCHIIDYDTLFNIDYNLIHNEYIKQYLNNFNEFLNDNFNIDVKFHNVELYSPKYYNFETDVIYTNISDLNAKKLISAIFKLNDNITSLGDFREWLKLNTVSYDGYISFYNYHEVLENKDTMLIQYILKYICYVLFIDEEYISLYDINNNYELLYNIDFYKENIS